MNDVEVCLAVTVVEIVDEVAGLLHLGAHGSETGRLRLTYGGLQALCIILVSAWLVDLKLAELAFVLACLDSVLQSIKLLAQETCSLSMSKVFVKQTWYEGVLFKVSGDA